MTRSDARRQRWAQRWKPALDALTITFADRLPAAETC
jgi:transposase-like protein